MPQPSLPLIFSLGPEHHILDPRRGNEVVTDSFIAGLSQQAALVGGREFAGIQIDLTPPSARRLLGGVTAELTGHSVPVGDILGRDALALQDQLRDTDDWARRIALVDRWLVRRLAEPDHPTPELDRAWQLLDRTGGAMRIGAMAQEVGWSPRHLRRRFAAAFGVSPKVAARIVRLHRTWRSIIPGAPTDLARLAITHGYADQAHFTNEVREMTGFPPGALLQAQRPLLGATMAVSSKPAPTTAP